MIYTYNILIYIYIYQSRVGILPTVTPVMVGPNLIQRLVAGIDATKFALRSCIPACSGVEIQKAGQTGYTIDHKNLVVSIL